MPRIISLFIISINCTLPLQALPFFGPINNPKLFIGGGVVLTAGILKARSDKKQKENRVTKTAKGIITAGALCMFGSTQKGQEVWAALLKLLRVNAPPSYEEVMRQQPTQQQPINHTTKPASSKTSSAAQTQQNFRPQSVTSSLLPPPPSYDDTMRQVKKTHEQEAREKRLQETVTAMRQMVNQRCRLSGEDPAAFEDVIKAAEQEMRTEVEKFHKLSPLDQKKAALALLQQHLPRNRDIRNSDLPTAAKNSTLAANNLAKAARNHLEQELATTKNPSWWNQGWLKYREWRLKAHAQNVARLP